MNRNFVFSSESVTEGHPDKVADNISDAVLDAIFRKDPFSRVACESFVATDIAIVAGEITTTADVDYEKIVRETIARIGYDRADRGMDGRSCELVQRIVPQSPDIAQGTAARKDRKIGAGDQGMMFGYAESTHGLSNLDYMPVPISLAHGLTRRLTEVRKNKTLGYLRPDGKSQVTVRFKDAKPVAVDAVVIAAQHDSSVDQEQLQEDIRNEVVANVVPEPWLHKETKYFINHTGRFEKGGPAADTGLTGRKIIVDTYGGWIPHGGGAFSGKDPTKVDRSAAYYARYAAKNLVAAGVAERLQIQVAYAIGSLEPLSFNVETFGTGAVKDDDIVKMLRKEFDFAPGAIIEQLGLRAPIYQQTAAYGHFGRHDLDLPWERLDKVEDLEHRLAALA